MSRHFAQVNSRGAGIQPVAVFIEVRLPLSRASPAGRPILVYLQRRSRCVGVLKHHAQFYREQKRPLAGLRSLRQLQFHVGHN